MYLDGISLEALSSRVKIVDIIEHPPEREVQTVDRAKYHGQMYMQTIILSRVIEVQFVIRARDKNIRRVILDDVLEHFDKNGVLTLNNRLNQEIYVVCTSAPAADSLRDYMNVLTLEYTSYAPFWRSSEYTTASVTLAASTKATVDITPQGNIEHPLLEFDLVSGSAYYMNTFEIEVNGYSFSFTSLGLAGGGTLSCYYDDDGFLAINADGVSVLNKRTGDDDLILNACETNTVTVTAAKVSTLTVKSRGLWK